ncbi:hypothetical protein M758_5G135000 [Ceratodon purpureus]|nr:hypothetical protein M758_5G135000 [Ceratodon purpureus]
MMSEEELNSGVGRMGLRNGRKKNDSNWVMLAGGAIAIAASLAFGRKKILENVAEVKKILENVAEVKKTLAASESCLTVTVHALPQDDDENGSVQSPETVPNGSPQRNNSQLALPSTEAAFEFRSFKPKRPASTDHSPVVTKFIRQSSFSPEFSKNEVFQSDTRMSPTTPSGVIAKRSDIVSRLRQQVRSRDAVIYDMQTQIRDQDQMVALHQNHCVDLQDCVQDMSTKLFEANLGIQRLQRELMTQRANPIVDLDEEFIDYAISKIKRQWVHPEDVEDLIVEARKLNEEVEHLRREKESKERVAQSKSRQCELLSKKLSALATELEEVKSAADGKQRLLEATEEENLKLTNIVQDLQRKLEIEAKGNDSQKRSVNMKSIMKRADVRNINFGHSVDRPIIPTTHEELPSTSAYYPSGNARKLHGSVHVRNGNIESPIRGEPRCLFGSHAKKREAPGNQDGRVQDPENTDSIDESLILKFEYDVDQLASALSVTSKMVSEKLQHANDLEQVAKQQDLEREMKELTKHQAKIVELKHLMAKITAKFNVENIEDDGFNREVLRWTSFVFDLERKLSAQEKIAKETSLIIQQLSPSNPSTQKAWRTVQETPRRPPSHNMHQEHAVIGTANENSRHALHEESPSHFWERPGFPSALRNSNQNRNKNTERQISSPVKLLERPYEFQIGAPDSLPPSASRARSRVASRRQPTSVEKQSPQGFRPDPEPTNGFSFDHRIAQGAEQGDRMSSPEPDRFPAFKPSPESCITPGSTKRFRPNYTGSEFSPSPGFKSLFNTPAYDESRYSSLAQFGSPWFGDSKEEPSSRLSRPLFKSPSPSTSALDSTTELRNLDRFTSGRELDTSEDKGKIKRSIGGKAPHPGRNSRYHQNSATSSSNIGVSPFAARMAQLKVGSPGSFDKGQVSQDDEGVGWDSVKDRHLLNKDVEALYQSIANLDALEGERDMRESRDSSGSCNPDDPLVLLPSFLRRSNESSNRHH